MKNIDISRDSFQPGRGFSRLVWQQGRPQLDADLNEHASILLHTLRTMMMDLAGRFGGPVGACGFRIVLTKDDVDDEFTEADRKELTTELAELPPGDLLMSTGRYYVDGLLCENSRLQRHSIQEAGNYLVYLDVWEQEVTALDDDAIREVALGGTDTSARMQVKWRVRAIRLSAPAQTFGTLNPPWDELAAGWQHRHRGALKARARTVDDGQPDAGSGAGRTYRGPENQLYRVEIHRGGKLEDRHRPTFKFSRDNGVVAFRVDTVADDGLAVTLASWGRDDNMNLAPGQFVELTDGEHEHHRGAAALAKIVFVDPLNRQVKVDAALFSQVPRQDARLVLRRWDQLAGEPRRGGLELSEGAALIVEQQWLTLEDGVEIMFDKAHGHEYRSGDYWLIPARVVTGDVLWPQKDRQPAALPPHGVEHHYAPLAIVDSNGETLSLVVPLTRRFGAQTVKGFPDDMFVYIGQP
ncbi:DUF6519 domain-containing protein [Caballeronia sp. SEWSISQ10-4 2]|uniref:DUF6519 domain-containing protein n=1 Tax=Caballeronia sp. SEWSISQ10-4 2 TaxID=2937438 RepID=UPI00264B6C25|nr:DUF6519 domain-containing protein [Caballeronia sp. SEWSISQ10-4 2]MDN7179635.1 DUF6519 domain-containing protein [Caballeronia sp. SEWSISQ10-4 2]